MRLRDLQIRIGDLETGTGNAVTDVPGLRVGYVESEQSALGLTILQPFADHEPRRTWVGCWALDGGEDATGLGLADDFGALSSPIVLAPAAAVGRVYDAMIQWGLRIDSGLPEDRGWPPAILSVSGMGVSAIDARAAFSDRHVESLLASAATGRVAEGQVGIGRSLMAFGCAAGVGTSSRVVGDHTLGVLVAANGGEPQRLRIAGHAVDPNVAALPSERARSSVAVVVTDAPLLPGQLRRLAGRASFGLVRAGLLDDLTHDAAIWAISTTAPVDVVDAKDATIEAGGLRQQAVPVYYAAAAEALEEAVVNALLAGSQYPGPAPVLSSTAWADAIRRQQRALD